MSAMPIGMPGWPDLALLTASTASMRSALASVRRSAAGFTWSSGARISIIVFPPIAFLDGSSFGSVSLFLAVHQLPDQRRDDELHGQRHLAAGADDGVGTRHEAVLQ